MKSLAALLFLLLLRLPFAMAPLPEVPLQGEGVISRVNFASGGAAGLYVGKFHRSAELRFTHISDAGVTSSNPGINTLQTPRIEGR
jgi:hypothetical protein